ncbi:MBL fold hydrolase [Deinococcus aetherius]|uniref:MBL fold hydrolase n=1 Tax=Deinococcus aetherius TaxID=200252 RepID=A0ABM8ADD6_9DEIO|nr:MBL fold metallo-hydrolase [Deinococcus aetherius]BDP41793.1 MBL fold hydrolase [Deinococcus aetherius]
MLEYRTFGANTYLLQTDEGPLLVDSGLAGTREKVLHWAREAGVKAVLLTHHHPDHAGGARFLWESLGLPMYAHPLDLPYLTGETPRPTLPVPVIGRFLSFPVPPVPRAALQTLDEGDTLMGWQVVHLPGHTPGQIGLLRDGVLVAADAIASRRGQAVMGPPFFTADMAQAHRTVRKIADLAPREVYVGHGPVTTADAVRALADKLGV